MKEHSSSIYRKFSALDAEVQGHIHAGLRSAPLHNKRYVRWHWKRLADLQNARDAAREEWRKVAPPEPSRKEKMCAAARGHEDLASTHAARRICAKNGWEWNS